jgi:hypothetical protein
MRQPQDNTMNDINTITDHAPIRSELAEGLEHLNAQLEASAAANDLPNALPHADIKTMPEVFYTRGTDWSEYHVGLHCKTLQAGFEFQPLLVIRVADETILVDGHHRLEAYRRVKNSPVVPVRYFPGTPSEALLEAVRRNAQSSIQMDGPQRHTCAWRLVLTRLYSKRDIVRASGVSHSQVGNMRVAALELGEAAVDMPTWSQAQKAWKGKSRSELTDSERELWVLQQGERGAEGLRKQFGMWLAKKPEIAAQALAIYFGRNLPEVYRELREHLAEDDYSFGSPDDIGTENKDGLDF